MKKLLGYSKEVGTALRYHMGWGLLGLPLFGLVRLLHLNSHSAVTLHPFIIFSGAIQENLDLKAAAVVTFMPLLAGGALWLLGALLGLGSGLRFAGIPLRWSSERCRDGAAEFFHEMAVVALNILTLAVTALVWLRLFDPTMEGADQMFPHAIELEIYLLAGAVFVSALEMHVTGRMRSDRLTRSAEVEMPTPLARPRENEAASEASGTMPNALAPETMPADQALGPVDTPDVDGLAPGSLETPRVAELAEPAGDASHPEHDGDRRR